MDGLRQQLAGLAGKRIGNLTVEAADEFAYEDPVDGTVASRQGIRIAFQEGARAVFRLSGTGTSGATLRIYLERYMSDPKSHALDLATALADVVSAARSLADLERRIGRTEPDVVA
jgi:phosphoglucomutase